MNHLREKAEDILTTHISFSSAMCHNEAERFESLKNAMLEMYHLDRPKVMVFDANDTKTFPKVRGLYWAKEGEHWFLDRWIMGEADADKWDYMPMKLVTHYAEILMPE